MTLRKTTSTSDPSRDLGAVLGEPAELPRGARQVLERVFWQPAPPRRREATVLPMPSRDALRAHPGTKQEA